MLLAGDRILFPDTDTPQPGWLELDRKSVV